VGAAPPPPVSAAAGALQWPLSVLATAWLSTERGCSRRTLSRQRVLAHLQSNQQRSRLQPAGSSPNPSLPLRGSAGGSRGRIVVRAPPHQRGAVAGLSDRFGGRLRAAPEHSEPRHSRRRERRRKRRRERRPRKRRKEPRPSCGGQTCARRHRCGRAPRASASRTALARWARPARDRALPGRAPTCDHGCERRASVARAPRRPNCDENRDGFSVGDGPHVRATEYGPIQEPIGISQIIQERPAYI
jgi:hypothetical protein